MPLFSMDNPGIFFDFRERERERERERDVQYRDWGVGTEGELQERPCHSHSQLVT
jgi:hypothetical protein